MKNENILIDKALEALFRKAGVRINALEYEPFVGDNRRADAIIQLEYQGVRKKYYVETKKRFTTQNMVNVINQIEAFPGDGMIIADYINPNIADNLKGMNMPFLDTYGNAYINEPPIYVFIKGYKPDVLELKQEKTTRAFQQTGLKVVFAYLCNEDLVNKPYREISKITNVAVGTVGWVIYDLKREGFVIELGKKRKKLNQKETLFNKWVEGYNERLRPKLKIGVYKTADYEFWKNLDIKKYNAFWGGEIAGHYYTNYLKPEITTIYVENEKEKLMKLLIENRLKENIAGNVEIYEKFWKDELNINFNNQAHPMITYADLVATGDPRNIETARLIYDKEIYRYIG